jgi:outer membrane lipoprotein LolB
MLRLAVALLASLLGACATQNLPVLPVTDESRQLWQQRMQQLDKLDHWDMRGRVVIYIRDEVHSAGLIWHRQQDNMTLKLEGPFGQGAMLLEQASDGITLTSADGKYYSGTDPQQLLYRVTGLLIPVEGLQTWIKGIPHTESSQSTHIEASGRAENIQQDGWSINYLEYEHITWKRYNDPYLPRKLYLKNNDLALKIVIDQWRDPVQPGTPSLFPDFSLN